MSIELMGDCLVRATSFSIASGLGLDYSQASVPSFFQTLGLEERLEVYMLTLDGTH